MKRLVVPYGDRTMPIEIDEKYILDIISMPEFSVKNEQDVLTDALKNPVGGRSFIDFIGNEDRMNIIVNDAARPTRTAIVLSTIHDFIKERNIDFVVATGAHRAPSRQELMSIFGNHYEKIKEQIAIHDARDDSLLDHVGKTRYGNDIWLNRLVTRNDRMLILGSIEPHYFAGYTGDRKALLPGLAGYRTIEKNHSLALHVNAKPLKLNGNPVHEEMLDCVAFLDKQRIYSIQMILDRHKNIYKVYAGPLIRTLEAATDDARRIFSARINGKADIVVTVARRPFDSNLYQTLKSIEHGRIALNEGGILIFVSPCPEGLGPESFARLFENTDGIETATIKARSKYSLGDHNAHNLMTLREQGKIWGVTEIAAPILARASIRKFDSLQTALDQSIKEKGKEDSLLFLTDGSMTVPEINRY